MEDITKNTNTENTNDAITAISYSPDGRFVAGVQGNRIILWERNSGKRYRSFISKSRLVCIAYSPDGEEIVVGDSNGSSTVYSKGGKLLRHLN